MLAYTPPCAPAEDAGPFQHNENAHAQEPKKKMKPLAPPANEPAKKDINRSEIVYINLRRAIIEQALLPGDKLPEDVIGERFGVSRTIVRGVLTRLFSDCLLYTSDAADE